MGSSYSGLVRHYLREDGEEAKDAKEHGEIRRSQNHPYTFSGNLENTGLHPSRAGGGREEVILGDFVPFYRVGGKYLARPRVLGSLA